MAFSIKNNLADRLARNLAAITGESLTEAVVNSLCERLARWQPTGKRVRAGTELARIAVQLNQLPILDNRGADEILGYDDHGLT